MVVLGHEKFERWQMCGVLTSELTSKSEIGNLLNLLILKVS